MTVMTENAEVVQDIVCDILEIELDEITPDGSFEHDYDADSLRAVEILAALEKEFKIKIPQNELPNMSTLDNVFKVLKQYGWEE